MRRLICSIGWQLNLRCISSILGLAFIAMPHAARGAPPRDLCRVLRAFIVSVQPKESREFVFRTAWLSNFEGEAEPAIFAKRCEHGGYPPAAKVCAYLMEHGATEFAGTNVQDSISCLSRKTKFDDRMVVNEGKFSFGYGSDHRGALISISFNNDPKVGGMAFRLVAHGY